MDARRRRGKSRLNQQKLMRHFFSPISSSSIGKREREKKTKKKNRGTIIIHISRHVKNAFGLCDLRALSSLWPSTISPFEPGRSVRNEGHLRADELDVRERGGFGFALSLSAFFFFLLSLVYVFHFLLRVKRWTVENQWGEQPGISVPISLPRCSCFFFLSFSFIWASYLAAWRATRCGCIVLQTLTNHRQCGRPSLVESNRRPLEGIKRWTEEELVLHH